MKIAVLAPSPVPFVIGGAEKLFFSLVSKINQLTTHQCELIKIPTKEKSFWDIIDSYYQFYTLDLNHFDMVISGKYPAWINQHKNHHIYMLHPLRGLYDSYDYNKFDLMAVDIQLKPIFNYISNEESDIDGLFELLFKLRFNKSFSKEVFTFPSFLAKEIIHFLDKKAMLNIKTFSAISKTVASRTSYFPNNIKPKIIYPPSSQENFYSSSYKYLFTASRLDKAKRIDMIIKAYLKSNIDIPLKIAGIGSEESYLKSLVNKNSKVEFLGYLSDIELKNYYANAYAIIFVPKDEDYGLITIEAMQSKKAVITCNDSGGVLEFVEHNKTGLVAQANIDSLSDQFLSLAKEPYLVQIMGENAYNKVKNITWQNTISKLPIQKKHLVILSTYPIYPPRGGGQNRVFYLFKALLKYFSITVLSLVHSSLEYTKEEIVADFMYIQIPKTSVHQSKEDYISKQIGIASTDIVFMDNFELTPQYKQELLSYIANTDFIFTSVYTYPLIKSLNIDVPVVYESQNVEYILKKNLMKTNQYSKRLLEKLYIIEKECYLNTYLVTFCSLDDKNRFDELYAKRQNNVVFIPNGVDLDSVNYYTKKYKKLLKSTSQYANYQNIAIFAGSAHQPNIEAVFEILNFAKKTSQILYIIIGDLKTYFQDIKIPKNVKFTGMISNKEKDNYLAISDIALNPMLKGSGTNLKMLDYLASGVPTISTPIGARGLNLPKRSALVVPISDFVDYLPNLSYYVDTVKAKRFVRKNYDWKLIADKLYKYLL